MTGARALHEPAPVDDRGSDQRRDPLHHGTDPGHDCEGIPDGSGVGDHGDADPLDVGAVSVPDLGDDIIDGDGGPLDPDEAVLGPGRL